MVPDIGVYNDDDESGAEEDLENESDQEIEDEEIDDEEDVE